MRVHRWVSETQGATLIEILVAIVLAAVVGLAAGGAYVFATRLWFGSQVRLETQQNLRVAVERLSRQLRLAGACLPHPGNEDLRALSGRDSELRVRVNVRCAVTTTRDKTPEGTNLLEVERTQGFIRGMDAYVLHPDNQGEYVQVEEVIETPPMIKLRDNVRREYPIGSAVYAAEEQLYQIQNRDGVPTLMLTIGPALGRDPEPLARGIEGLNVQYVLNRPWRQENCTGAYPLGDLELCMVNQPTSDAEWALVRAVRVTVRARSVRPVPGPGPWQFYRMEEMFDVKPRNLLKPPPQD